MMCELFGRAEDKDEDEDDPSIKQVELRSQLHAALVVVVVQMEGLGLA